MSIEGYTSIGPPPPVDPPKFWKGDASQKDIYRAAIVCRRGHPQATYLERYPTDDPGRCAECGANILIKCGRCGLRIRGTSHSIIPQPGRAISSDYLPPNFCDNCGDPHPWASRQARLYQLENLLDEEDIDEADRLLVTEHLRQLRELGSDDDLDQQTKLWSAIKRRAPGLFAGAGIAIIKTLIDITIRHTLKINE